MSGLISWTTTTL